MPPTEPRPPSNPPAPVHADVAREESDVRIPAVLWFGFWLFAGAIAIHLAMWGVFRLFAWQENKIQPALDAGVAASLKRTPSAPRLEPLPLATRRILRAEEDARLASYGWVDRPAGVAHIPIDRAMALIVEHGVPGGKPFPPPTPEPGPAPTPAPMTAAPASLGAPSR